MRNMTSIWQLTIVASLVSIHGIAGSFRLFPGLMDTDVALAQVLFPPENQQLAQYKPPEGADGTPIGTVGGGSRGNCEVDAEHVNTAQFHATELKITALTALMPKLPDHLPNYGITVSASPEFFIYIPQTIASNAEFVLKDDREMDVYRTTVPLSGEVGTLIVRLPEEIALEVNRNYHWYFSLICNPAKRVKDIEIDGWTRRIELDAVLASQLENADPLIQSNLYGNAGIWHDAIAILAQLRQDNPDDAIVAQKWKVLLESAGLQEFVETPLEVISLGQTSEL